MKNHPSILIKLAVSAFVLAVTSTAFAEDSPKRAQLEAWRAKKAAQPEKLKAEPEKKEEASLIERREDPVVFREKQPKKGVTRLVQVGDGQVLVATPLDEAAKEKMVRAGIARVVHQAHEIGSRTIYKNELYVGYAYLGPDSPEKLEDKVNAVVKLTFGRRANGTPVVVQIEK